MPVARIISQNFEDALKFADHLRPFFDTVEIAQPGRASATPVDLEVNLELCTPEQAWQQVSELANQPDTDLFIAPGTLVPAAQVEAAAELAPAQLGMQQEFAAAVNEVGAGAGRAKSELNWLARSRESLRQWMALRAQLRAVRHVEQERLQHEQERQRHMALQFERERREREAQERELARAAERQLALQKAESLRLQQEEARRLQQEAVLRRQIQEERQRQAQQALQPRQAEELAPPPVQAAATVEAEAVPVEAQMAEAVAASPSEPELPPVRTKRDNRLRPAMAMAAVTSVLLTAALLGYANRRPASPVPFSVLQRSNAVEQSVPFGPAVIPAATLGVPALAATAAPAATQAPALEKHQNQSDFRRVRVGGNEVDYVSDDVTVRHFNVPHRGHVLQHPASDAPASAGAGGVKQISDMESPMSPRVQNK